MSGISDERLAELERLAEAATPGARILGSLTSYDGMTGRPCRFVYRGHNDSAETRIRITGGEGENGQVFDCDADAALIAATDRETVLAMLAELRQARAERDEARASHERLSEELWDYARTLGDVLGQRDEARAHEKRLRSALDEAIRIYPSLADLLDLKNAGGNDVA